MNESDRTLHLAPPKMIEWAVVVALGLLALFLLAQTMNTFSNSNRIPATNTITVSGMGKASAAPDIAHITFTIEHTSATVADAQSATTKQANDVIDYVKGQGVPAKDIRTVSYNVSPQYSYPNPCSGDILCPVTDRSPKITGYQVSETVEITVRDLDKVSTLLGGLGQKNVQNLYGPNFTLDDPTAPQNAAREEAIQKAKAQADELAKELGVRLVRIVNFSEGGNYPYYAKAYSMGGGMATEASMPAPDVPQGENEYTANVSITYEIR